MIPAWLVVAEAQARELSRRRLALALLVGLTFTWYVAEVGSGVNYGVGAGLMGLSWSAGAASLFAVIAARPVDPRLIQAGYRSRDLLIGRTAVLLTLALAVAAFFGVAIVIGSHPDRPATFLVALAVTAVVSAPVGWVVALLVPRELEGCLVLIGLMGIQISVPDLVAPYLPLYVPLTLTDADVPYAGGLAGPALRGIAYAAALSVVTALLWRRRVRAVAGAVRTG